MSQVAPAGPVYQAGTLSGNPLAMAAGLATLRKLTPNAYARLDALAGRLEDGLVEACRDTGVDARVQRVGSMLTLFFSSRRPRRMEDVKAADHERFGRFFARMLDQGIHLPPSGYEAWFVSLAHDEEVIDQTVERARLALEGLD